jgi:hypothetical protein
MAYTFMGHQMQIRESAGGQPRGRARLPTMLTLKLELAGRFRLETAARQNGLRP